MTATTALAAGTHDITAEFSGDANHSASTSAILVQTVAKAASSITLVTDPPQSMPGQPVTLIASATGFNPTGSVTFMDGQQVLGTAMLNNGVATLVVTDLRRGNRQVSASYPGDENNLASTSPRVRHFVRWRAPRSLAEGRHRLTECTLCDQALHHAHHGLGLTRREAWTFVALVIVLVGFGLAPRPPVDSRLAAGEEILRVRQERQPGP